MPYPAVQNVPGQERKQRRPDHSFYLKQIPFVIQPFMLAPVLPGETMVNLLLQARVVTDPIKNPLIGWWLEYYFFYVKHRDFVGSTATVNFSTTMQQLMLDPTFDVSAQRSVSTNPAIYAADGGLAFTHECLRRVVDTYFRAGDEDRATAAGLYNGVGTSMMAQVNTLPGWMESFAPATALQTDDVELLDISAMTTFSGGDDKLHTSELEQAYRQWSLLTMQNLTTQTYDEYLATFGIRPPSQEAHMPEMIRAIKAWQYPSNTIDPTNGTPRSAVSWSITERADKRRFFSEPGFIFGVSIVRPKVYSAVQIGSMAEFMDNAYKWMPAVLSADPKTGVGSYSNTADAPLNVTTMTADYMADMRDLFHGGDQFINIDPTTAGINSFALPSADATNKRYPSVADISGLFVTPTTAEFVKQDGIVRLSIESALGRGFDREGYGASSRIVPV